MSRSFMIYRIITAVSIVLFSVALTQECFCTTVSCGNSLAVFLSGSIGFVLGGAALTWLANPLLIISWFKINTKPRVSLIISSVALLISLSFMLFKLIVSDEAGNYSEIISYKSGYWLWVASIGAMVIGNVLLMLLTPKNEVK